MHLPRTVFSSRFSPCQKRRRACAVFHAQVAEALGEPLALDGPSASLVGDVAADAVLIARDEREAARPRMSDVVLHDGLARRAAACEEVEDEAVGLRREVDDPLDQPDGLRASEHDISVEELLQIARPLPRVADLVFAPHGRAHRSRAHLRQEPLQPRDVVAGRPEPDAPVRD